MTQQNRDELLVHQAKTVLDYNWTGDYTQPGPRLYPHQWSWDSALIAIACSRYDRGRVEKEMAGAPGRQGVFARAQNAMGVGASFASEVV